MQIGVPLDELSPLFYGCLAVAIWLVYMFCKQRFAERSVAGSSEWIYQLLPRQLATREEYSKGFLTYFGTMAAIVVLLSLLGPKNLGELGITLPQGAGYIIVPFFIAFVLIGALPNVPGLMAMEKYLRAYAHKRAYIPDAALATAERLAAADFDFSSYQGEALQSPEMRGVEPVDFTRSRHCLTHSWARLCCLVFVQKSCRMDGVTNSLDASLLRYYEKDLEIIESQKKSMEAEVAAYRLPRRVTRTILMMSCVVPSVITSTSSISFLAVRSVSRRSRMTTSIWRWGGLASSSTTLCAHQTQETYSSLA